MLTPPNWRQIAIEDALEGIPSRKLGKHNVTFKVDPFDSLENGSHTKSNEMIRLLHRSPDWVFLGELQTAEHSAAMFHAVSAGIKGIQTCHSASNDELLLRWLIHHKIPEVCFQSLGLLIHMVREISCGQIIRRVAQISEINFQTPKPSLGRLFEWNKASAQLKQLQKDPFSPLIKRTCKFLQEDQVSIHRRFNLYKGVLETLVNHQIFNPHSVIQTFDEAHARLVKKEPSFQERSAEDCQFGGEIVRSH